MGSARNLSFTKERLAQGPDFNYAWRFQSHFRLIKFWSKKPGAGFMLK